MGTRNLSSLLDKRRVCPWCSDPGCFFQRKVNSWAAPAVQPVAAAPTRDPAFLARWRRKRLTDKLSYERCKLSPLELLTRRIADAKERIEVESFQHSLFKGRRRETAWKRIKHWKQRLQILEDRLNAERSKEI